MLMGSFQGKAPLVGIRSHLPTGQLVTRMSREYTTLIPEEADL